MAVLRNMIDTNCQVIFAGNWESQTNDGWRWFTNMDLEHFEVCRVQIREAQRDFGVMNVTTGHPFSERHMKPLPASVTKFVGLYVRDTQDMLKALSDALEDDVQIARWLDA